MNLAVPLVDIWEAANRKRGRFAFYIAAKGGHSACPCSPTDHPDRVPFPLPFPPGTPCFYSNNHLDWTGPPPTLPRGNIPDPNHSLCGNVSPPDPFPSFADHFKFVPLKENYSTGSGHSVPPARPMLPPSGLKPSTSGNMQTYE